MQKRGMSSKLRRLVREQNFKLDCTNINETRYREYNSLKDKYVKYLVPCPCSFFVKNQCKPAPLPRTNVHTNHTTYVNNTTYTQASSDASFILPAKISRKTTHSLTRIGRIVKNKQT
jgi:hypothetical protein